MRKLTEQERAAIQAVAARFGATMEEREQGALISHAGKRIAVDVAPVKQRLAHPAEQPMPRLRFDRVALRLVARLQAALSQAVADGQTVIVTVTAPIRLPRKTAETLEDNIRALLAGASSGAEHEATVHGNQTRVRVLGGSLKGAAKVIGFVHNPGSNADGLFEVTRSLIECICARAGEPTPECVAYERWLVLAAQDQFPHVETYKLAWAQLAAPTGFARILLVCAGDRVATLAGADGA